LWPRSPISATAELLFQKILCCARNTIFFEKIMCCDSKSNVLWQTCYNTLFFQKILCCGRCAQHNIFWKKI